MKRTVKSPDAPPAEQPSLARRKAREIIDLNPGASLTEIVAPLKRYHHSGEINFEVEDKDAVMKALEEKYAPFASNVIRIDGLRMEFFDAAHPENDWWFSVPCSRRRQSWYPYCITSCVVRRLTSQTRLRSGSEQANVPTCFTG